MFLKEKAKEYISLYYCRNRNVQDFFVAKKNEITLENFDESKRIFYDIDNEQQFYYICQKYKFIVPDANIKKRFDEKSHFCVLVEDDHYGCWGWYNTQSSDFYLLEIDRTVVIPNDTAVLFHYYSNPDYRRKGFYYDLLRNVALKNGQNYSVIYAYDTNPASSNAIKKAGYKFAGRYNHKNFDSIEKLILDTEC